MVIPSVSWREVALSRLSKTGSFVFGPVVLAANFFTPGLRDHPGILAFFTLLYFVWIYAAFSRNLSYETRAVVFLSVLFSYAVSLLWKIGFSADPTLVMVAACLLGGVWLGRNTGLGLVLACGTLIAVYGYLDSRGLVPSTGLPGPGQIGSGNWIRITAAFVAVTGFLGEFLGYLIERYETTVKENTEALRRIQEEQAQREQAEVKSRRAAEALAEAQKLEAVGRLASGVAHDFNNALGAIMGWLHLIRSPRTSEADRQLGLESITRSAERASQLTRQLLTLGRKGVRTPRPTAVRPFLEDLVQTITRLFPANIRIGLDAGDTPAVVVDESQFEQILLNLTLNARDAMPNGGRLDISARRAAPAEVQGLASGTDYVTITVRDSGSGIDEAVRSRIFEPFFTTKSLATGTGLGLATVHAIVEETGGRIRVESAPGEGTTFHILLPAAAGEAVKAPETPRPALVDGKGYTVLVVEDEPAIRIMQVKVLEYAGFTVLEAGNGETALKLAMEHPDRIDLLLTDAVIPGLGAKALIDAFRNRFPETAVLVCSGYVEEDTLLRHITSGLYSFLQKPFTAQQLLEAVYQAITASNMTRRTA